MISLWKLSLHNAFLPWNRAALSILGLGASVLTFLCLFALTAGLNTGFSEYYLRLDGYYLIQKGTMDPVFSQIPGGLEDRVRRLAGVTKIRPEIWGLTFSLEGTPVFRKNPLGFISLGGFEGTDSVYHRSLIRGRIPHTEADSGVQEALISERLAESYGKAPGDQLSVNGKTLLVVGIYRTGSFFLDSSIIISLNLAREITRKAPDVVSAYFLETSGNPEALAEELAGLYPDLDLRHGLVWMDDLKGILDTARNFSTSVMGVSLVMAFLLLFSTLMSNTRERWKDLGILSAEGWSIRELAVLMVLESSFLCLAGWAVGVLCALGLLWAGESFWPVTPRLELQLIPWSLGLIALTGLLAAGLNILSLKRLKPSEVLRCL